MGPKKGKDSEVNDNFWRTSIETAILDEEEWKVKVILIEAAGSDQDRIYLNKFETFAAEEKRFVIKNICKTETVFMINQLGTEKKVKDESLRVFEEGNAFLKEKNDIPPDIYALIIKHLIMKMKEEYLFIKRQRLEVQEGMRRESATMLNKAEVKGTVSGVPPSPSAAAPPISPPPPTQGPPQVPELPSDKKFNTSLRERGEEWRDKVYVDDYPTDGPNLYVAITGFVEAFLPGCLVKIGIPLTAVVQIRIDPIANQIPSSLTRPTKRGQSQTELLQDQSLKFWDMLQSLRIQEESADDFKNTAFIVYSPPYWKSDELSGNADIIYDELCYLMYDVQDLSRQHIHYLENLRIIHVPEDEYDARYKNCYHTYIDDLPLECVTIYSVLDSILATACKDLDLVDKNSRSSVSEAVTLNAISHTNNKFKKSELFVQAVFNTLCNTESNKKQYRLTYGEEYETHKDPTVIDYGDFAKSKTFHLGNINLDQIVFSSLLGMPVHNLWLRHERPEGELEAKANFHVNVLLSCFERADVETSELNRLIHILACRKLYNNRSSLKKRHIPTKTISDLKKVYLKRSILAEPLLKCPSIIQSNTVLPAFESISKSMNESVSADLEEDSEIQRIKFLFDCPDISELVSAAEIANNQPIKHMIDDFDCFEDFSGISAFQIMCEALNQFNCIDYKYCEVTDCFLLMFFNSHDKDGIAREEWRCHLASPVCLQDFFDYILEEHYVWIQNEERLYDENNILKAQSVSKDIIDSDALKSCVEDTEVDMDLLMEGSLKHQEFLAKKAEEEDNEANPVKELSLSSKKSVTSRTIDDKSSRKAKSPLPTTPKSGKKIIEPHPMDSAVSVEVPAKPFTGYDLGDRRVEVFGKDATYFARDGTKLSSTYSLIIPMNLEYIILNITTGNKNNEFWIHKALGECVKPEMVDICESFRITTKDQVMINIQKQTCEAPVEPPNTSITENTDKKSLLMVSSTVQAQFETKYFHSLFITWPNGMITETVHENNSTTISHIKQYYVCQMPNLDEDMRCISLNGEVIIFKTSGIIEVLRPDGSNIKVTNCFKRIVSRDYVEEQTEDVSDKSKKGKGKGKSSKGSSKSSKNVLSEEEKLPDVKPIEYELVIDEFEMTEPNGLRQQYVRDIPFHIEKLLIRTATDYCLGEIFSKRMDGTTTLLNKDGVLIVTFPNKTRIITYYIIEDEEIYPEWTDEEKEYLASRRSDVEVINSKYSISQRSNSDSDASKKMEEEEVKEKEKERVRSDGYISINIIYTIEHAKFSTVTINKFSEKIFIESPNETTVIVDKNVHYKFALDKKTTAHFDGERLNISYEACSDCRAFTTCNVKIKPASSETVTDQHWVTVKDSYGKRVVVNDEGAIATIDDLDSTEVVQPDELLEQAVLPENDALQDALAKSAYIDNKAPDGKSESSTTSHVKCRELYSAKTIRFFILKRDLTCSELIHRALLDRYQRDCRWQPWCSINEYNTFGDHRSLVSILTPIHLTQTEKWLMDSKLADKPKFLTYKDLKDDCGKGFYHWMRPYERFVPSPMKPENVLPPRLPRAFILRTLEQQWRESEREELKGARELLLAILRYRSVMESDSETLLHIPIIDPRTDVERRIDDYVQSLAHKIYHDLKERLADDVQKRARASITTRPAPVQPEEMDVAGEYGEELESGMRSHEDTDGALKQIDQAAEMSPNLQKYWKRRAEELKEEDFYKYLLREGSVPPYFLNVLGGAIWWEMNYTAGEAVTKSERRKAMCSCSGDDTSRTDGTVFNMSGFT